MLHKALEYHRLLQAKQGGAGCNNAQSVCCIDLACKASAPHNTATPHSLSLALPLLAPLLLCHYSPHLSSPLPPLPLRLCFSLRHPLSSAEVLRYSGHAKASTYAQVVRSTQALLDLHSTPTIPYLSIQYAATPSHSSLAIRLLSSYHQRLLDSLPPAQRSRVDLTRASHTLCAFYLAGRKSRDPIDRSVIQTEGGIALKEWKAVESSILHLCHDILGLTPRKRKTTSTSESSSVDDVLRGEECEAERVGEVDALVGSSTAAYAEWKERVIAEDAKDREAVSERIQSSNFDDEAEYGDDEETLEKKRRKGPQQTRLSFAPVAQTTPAKRRRGAYTDAVVL